MLSLERIPRKLDMIDETLTRCMNLKKKKNISLLYYSPFGGDLTSVVLSEDSRMSLT